MKELHFKNNEQGGKQKSTFIFLVFPGFSNKIPGMKIYCISGVSRFTAVSSAWRKFILMNTEQRKIIIHFLLSNKSLLIEVFNQQIFIYTKSSLYWTSPMGNTNITLQTHQKSWYFSFLCQYTPRNSQVGLPSIWTVKPCHDFACK